MIRATLPAALVAAFTIGLWGRVTPGVVLSAIVVGVALRPPWAARRIRVRPLPALRALTILSGAVVRSNVKVLREVLRPRPSGPQGIVDVALHHAPRGVDVLVSLATTLTPGTAVLEMRRQRGEPTILHVHVLRFDSAAEVREQVLAFEQLAMSAVSLPQPAPSAVPEAHVPSEVT